MSIQRHMAGNEENETIIIKDHDEIALLKLLCASIKWVKAAPPGAMDYLFFEFDDSGIQSNLVELIGEENMKNLVIIDYNVPKVIMTDYIPFITVDVEDETTQKMFSIDLTIDV